MPDDHAEVGHNSGVIPRDKFLAYYRQFAQLDAELDGVKARKKKLRGHMKAEGIVLADFDAFVRIESKDRDEQRGFFSSITTWLEYMQNPLHKQFSFDFGGEPVDPDEEDETAFEDLLDACFAKGFRRGVIGDECQPEQDGLDPTTPAGQKWVEGWNEGQTKAAMTLAPPPEKEKPKRGRPKKVKDGDA